MIRRRTLTAFLLAICASMHGRAQAEIFIGPGTTVTGVNADSNSEPPGAVLVAGPLTVNGSTTNPGGSYMFTEEVYKETGGTYDFLFQLKNTGTTTIADLSVTNYMGYTTLAGYETVVPTGFSDGTVGTPTISRSATGSVLDFVFDSSGLGAGATSDVFNIQTSANFFNQLGTSQLTDSSGTVNGGATINNIYQPFTQLTAVPEPSSLILCGLAGVIGFGRVTWGRKRAR